MSDTFNDLSRELLRFSENDKYFQYPYRVITFVNYLIDQFRELECRRKFEFHINGSNRHWSAQKHSFFKSFNNSFSDNSTDKEILLNLVRGLAKKIADIKAELYSNEALDVFAKNVTDLIDKFKNRSSYDHSPLLANSDFLSQFRKRKDPVKKIPDTDSNFNIQLGY